MVSCQLKCPPFRAPSGDLDGLPPGVAAAAALNPLLTAQGTRSTFLMAFSPCNTMMASTHGDHALYVSRDANDGSTQSSGRAAWKIHKTIIIFFLRFGPPIASSLLV